VGLGLLPGLALPHPTISRGSIADVIQPFRTDISLIVNFQFYIVVPLNQRLPGLQRTPLKPIKPRWRFDNWMFHGRAFQTAFHVARITLERPVEHPLERLLKRRIVSMAAGHLVSSAPGCTHRKKNSRTCRPFKSRQRSRHTISRYLVGEDFPYPCLLTSQDLTDFHRRLWHGQTICLLRVSYILMR
jgi:hypothetical protein